MRVALIRHSMETGLWSKETLLWGDIQSEIEILKRMVYRTQAFGMVTRFHPDILVVSVDNDWFYSQYEKTRAYHWLTMMDTNNVSQAPQLSGVDFGLYDLIVCSNPWVPDEQIRRYPQTVFAYWDYINPVKKDRPTGLYDLQLNHLEGTDILTGLPQEVYVHYPVDISVRSFFAVDRKHIGTDQRTVKENKEIFTRFDNIEVNGLTAVRQTKQLNGQDFYKYLSSCKYFLYVRNWMGGSGQVAMEAAALGCVVIGYHCKRPFNDLVHPFCKFEPEIEADPWHLPFPNGGFRDMAGVLEKMRAIEGSSDLYKEIMDHQDSVLNNMLEKTTTIFEDAIRLKRQV